MSPPDSFNDCNISQHRKLRLVRLRALQSGVGESRSKPPLRLLLFSWTESLDSLPRGALELPLLLRLLPELLVMVFAEVHGSRLPDQLEFGEGLLHLCGGEGALRFLPTTDDPAHFVAGMGPTIPTPIFVCARSVTLASANPLLFPTSEHPRRRDRDNREGRNHCRLRARIERRIRGGRGNAHDLDGHCRQGGQIECDDSAAE